MADEEFDYNCPICEFGTDDENEFCAHMTHAHQKPAVYSCLNLVASLGNGDEEPKVELSGWTGMFDGDDHESLAETDGYRESAENDGYEDEFYLQVKLDLNAVGLVHALDLQEPLAADLRTLQDKAEDMKAKAVAKIDEMQQRLHRLRQAIEEYQPVITRDMYIDE